MVQAARAPALVLGAGRAARGGRLLTWQHRARDRQQLQSLSDRLLRDIGLTRADVFAEASKPFWRP